MGVQIGLDLGPALAALVGGLFGGSKKAEPTASDKIAQLIYQIMLGKGAGATSPFGQMVTQAGQMAVNPYADPRLRALLQTGYESAEDQYGQALRAAQLNLQRRGMGTGAYSASVERDLGNLYGQERARVARETPLALQAENWQRYLSGLGLGGQLMSHTSTAGQEYANPLAGALVNLIGALAVNQPTRTASTTSGRLSDYFYPQYGTGDQPWNPAWMTSLFR